MLPRIKHAPNWGPPCRVTFSPPFSGGGNGGGLRFWKKADFPAGRGGLRRHNMVAHNLVHVWFSLTRCYRWEVLFALVLVDLHVCAPSRPARERKGHFQGITRTLISIFFVFLYEKSLVFWLVVAYAYVHEEHSSTESVHACCGASLCLGMQINPQETGRQDKKWKSQSWTTWLDKHLVIVRAKILNTNCYFSNFSGAAG